MCLWDEMGEVWGYVLRWGVVWEEPVLGPLSSWAPWPDLVHKWLGSKEL